MGVNHHELLECLACCVLCTTYKGNYLAVSMCILLSRGCMHMGSGIRSGLRTMGRLEVEEESTRKEGGWGPLTPTLTPTRTLTTPSPQPTRYPTSTLRPSPPATKSHWGKVAEPKERR